MSGFEVISSTPITGTKPGRPDYSGEVYRGKQIWGYVPEEGETPIMAAIIATLAPGPYPFTRPGIAVNETVNMIDPTTGFNGLNPGAGYDMLVKEIWINFDQPMRFQLISDQIGDVCCESYIPAYNMPLIQSLPIGRVRHGLEDISLNTRTTCRVTNLGVALAYGKSWVFAFRKLGIYEWV